MESLKCDINDRQIAGRTPCAFLPAELHASVHQAEETLLLFCLCKNTDESKDEDFTFRSSGCPAGAASEPSANRFSNRTSYIAVHTLN